MVNRQIKRREAANILLFVVTIISLFISNSLLLSVILIVISLMLLLYSQHNLMVFMSSLIIAYANYSICFYRYWTKDTVEDYNSFLQFPDIDLTGLKALIVFTGILTISIVSIYYRHSKTFHSQKVISMLGDKETKEKPFNYVLVVLSCVALVATWLFFYDFSFGEKAVYSAPYEYSTILFVLGLKYAGNNKLLIFPLLVLAAFYMLFDFIGGQRSTGVQIGIIVILMVFYNYLTPKKIIVLALGGIFVTSLVSAFRHALFDPDFSYKDILSNLYEYGFASDTAIQAYMTSLTFIAIMDIYPLLERLSQFAGFLLGIFIPRPLDDTLAWIAIKHYYHGFGGVLGIYMFYYLGYFGSAIIACLVGFYYRLMDKIKSSLYGENSISYVICVYVSATTVRWYNYSPSQLLRGVFLLSLTYFFYSVINKISKIKKI